MRTVFDFSTGVLSEIPDETPDIPSYGLVPAEVTMRQARLALLASGKLSTVESAINALPDPPKAAALIEWEYSNTVQRHNGFVSQIAPLIGMSSGEIDTLFIEASKL